MITKTKSDLIRVCNPKTDLKLIKNSFGPQPDDNTCGPCSLRHGMLLGGLLTPLPMLERLLKTTENEETDYITLLEGIRELGFGVEHITKPKSQSTKDFFNSIDMARMPRGFLLPCIYEGMHWVCIGEWDKDGVSIICSGHTRFRKYTYEEFDELEWEDCINVVRPGIWLQAYSNWFSYRSRLLSWL